MTNLQDKLERTQAEMRTWPFVENNPISQVTAERAIAFLKTILRHEHLKIGRGPDDCVVFEWRNSFEHTKIKVYKDRTVIYGETATDFYEFFY